MLKKLNTINFLGLLLLVITSCKPDQEVTAFNITQAPTANTGNSFETLMNNPVEVVYYYEQEKNIDVKVSIAQGPARGELTACQSKDFIWKCIYIPNEDYVGEDSILLKVKDGDFESDGTAKLNISILKYNYTESSVNIIIPSKGNTVCDPLTGNSTAEESKGLVGNIRLIKPDVLESLKSNLQNYLNTETSYQVPNLTLFMSKVDVPKRSFDQGFASQDNQVLKVNNEPLLEYFNVNLESELIVTQLSEVGEYEMAVISDDGSQLLVKEENNSDYRIYSQSNGQHSPRMICSSSNSGTSEYLDFQLGKKLAVKINYFQGPRYHIALQYIWRKKTPGQTRSNYCGTIIDPTDFANMINEGWSIIPAHIFNLPENVVNTCKEVGETIDSVSFFTDKPLDDSIVGLIRNVSIEITNMATGDKTFLNKDQFELSNGNIEGSKVKYTIDFNIGLDRTTDNDIKIIFQLRDQEHST